MASSGKYGKVGIPRIGEDEPVFILRAQDRLALRTVEIYKILAAAEGASVAKGLNEEIERFRRWPGPTKMPD